MRKLFLMFAIAALCLPAMAKKDGGNRVVVIMVDGLRWQELYTGADSVVINNKKYAGDVKALKNLFWRSTPEERRAEVFPFFWNYVAKNGIMYGNRLVGDTMEVANHMWFSYPGYNETMTGAPDDVNIKSNGPTPNPNVSVLEAANADPRYKGRVLAFGSWCRFHEIFNDKRNDVPVNAGWDSVRVKNPDEAEKFCYEAEEGLPIFWPTLRYDYFTFTYALEQMKREHPILTFIGLGEPDEFAHMGKYDQYLKSSRRFDMFVRKLWEYCQSDPFYSGKTTFIICPDHGRGIGDKWKDHWHSVPRSNETFFIAFGNKVKARGEMRGNTTHYNKQVAYTVADLLGLNFKSSAGTVEKPIPLK